MRTRTHLATTRDHSQTIKRRHHAWRGTCYVALHPLRGAAPVTWRCTRTERVQCPRIGCNAHGSGVPRSQIRTCVEPGIPQRERRRPKRPYTQTRTRPQAAASRVVLRPLRGAAPVAWRCTRTEWVQCLRIGCNARGSGVPRSRTRMTAEPGIPQHERKRPQHPCAKPGPGHKRRHHAGATPVEWRYTRYVALHPLSGAAPVTWRCTRYGALNPLRGAAPEQNGCNAHGSGAMPTDRVYRAPR